MEWEREDRGGLGMLSELKLIRPFNARWLCCCVFGGGDANHARVIGHWGDHLLRRGVCCVMRGQYGMGEITESGQVSKMPVCPLWLATVNVPSDLFWSRSVVTNVTCDGKNKKWLK